jgi:hypothetical protein
VVEQLAFNQRVGGSSPPRLTLNLTFRATEMVAFSFVYSFIYRFNGSMRRPGSMKAVFLAPPYMLTLSTRFYRKILISDRRLQSWPLATGLILVRSASARASFISTSACSSSLSSRNSSVETRRHPAHSSLLRFAAFIVHLLLIRNKLPFSGTRLTRHSLLDLILFKILKLIYPNIALGEMSDDL